ncbi:hypothetical protein TREMEDRAFT_43245, partial [Tremella mesenterica DSM 1558]
MSLGRLVRPGLTPTPASRHFPLSSIPTFFHRSFFDGKRLPSLIPPQVAIRQSLLTSHNSQLSFVRSTIRSQSTTTKSREESQSSQPQKPSSTSAEAINDEASQVHAETIPPTPSPVALPPSAPVPTNNQAPDTTSLLKLLSFARPQLPLISVGIFCLCISTGVSLAWPWAIGRIIDFFAPGSEATLLFGLPLEWAVGITTFALLIGAAANSCRSIALRLAGQRTMARIRNMTYAKFMALPPSHIETTGVGDALSRLSQDTSIIGNSLSENLGEGLKAVLSAVVGVGAMWMLSPSLTMCMLLVIPPISVSSFFYGKYIRKLALRTQEAMGNMSKLAEERLSAHRTVTALNNQSTEEKLFASKAGEVYKLQKKETVANGIFQNVNEVAGDIGMIGLLLYGGFLVRRGEISIGDMTSLLIYVNWIEWSLNTIAGFFTGLMKGVGASQRITSLHELPSPIPLSIGKPVPPERDGTIELRDVAFAYPARPDSLVLDGLNLRIDRGERVALVGGSGSGKSSVQLLLLRFYDPIRGQVLFDGQDIKSFIPESWRSRIGVVPQDPILFGGTIAENIAYGHPNATREEIIRAANIASCDFISRLPSGYDTIITKASLSGGQRQRIAIARALIGDPHVLLMDEATSALDAESERTVNLALQKLFTKSDITVILVAHRLSSIASADRVVLLEGGKVVEDGSYVSLITRRGGKFRKMVEGQMAKVGEIATFVSDDPEPQSTSE